MPTIQPAYTPHKNAFHRISPVSVSVLCALLSILGCETKPASKPSPVAAEPTVKRELTIAAASDLKSVLGEIIEPFEALHPEIHVNPTYGSSGNFFAQLSKKAPFDLFLSADISYPEKLIEMELADKNTLFSYAIGQIVVWVPTMSPLDVQSLEVKVFDDPSIQKIAIANPKHAPYGRAAQAALSQLGIFDRIADRLVLGENVAQTAMFVETGAADIGVIALSLAMSPALREKGKYWVIPQANYPKLEQAGVIVTWAKERLAAEQFREFLQTEQSRSILQSHGFTLPDKK